MSGTESQITDSKDDVPTTLTRGSESPMTTDNEMKTEEEGKDHWKPTVEEAMQKHKDSFWGNENELIWYTVV